MTGLGTLLSGAYIGVDAGKSKEDETHFVDPLFAIAGSGRTPAEELLEDFRTRWGGKIDPVFTDYAY